MIFSLVLLTFRITEDEISLRSLGERYLSTVRDSVSASFPKIDHTVSYISEVNSLEKFVFLLNLGFSVREMKISEQFTGFLCHVLTCVWQTGWRRFVFYLGQLFSGQILYHELRIHIYTPPHPKVLMRQKAHSCQSLKESHLILCYCSAN